MQQELQKIIDAAYSFKLLPLETIKVPTLVVLGENERKAVFPHADKMIELCIEMQHQFLASRFPILAKEVS